MADIKPIPQNKVRPRNKIEQHEHCDQADARRTKLVDEIGNPINNDNKLPVVGELNIAPAQQDPEQQVLEMLNAGQIYTVTIPPRTTNMEISVRSSDNEYVNFVYAWNNGDIGNGIFKTVECGNNVVLSNIYRNTARLVYFQADSDNTVLEVETFSEI